jgi:hypothetical protein
LYDEPKCDVTQDDLSNGGVGVWTGSESVVCGVWLSLDLVQGNEHQDALGQSGFPGTSRSQCAAIHKQAESSTALYHSHAAKVHDLSPRHGDPFDRMLIAQALVENMVVLSWDRSFKKYPAEILWCGT